MPGPPLIGSPTTATSTDPADITASASHSSAARWTT
jgi:hypothetical protein